MKGRTVLALGLGALLMSSGCGPTDPSEDLEFSKSKVRGDNGLGSNGLGPNGLGRNGLCRTDSGQLYRGAEISTVYLGSDHLIMYHPGTY